MIRVSLNRATDSDLFGGKAEVLVITIEDNGIVFNDENYDSFCELDTIYRASKCCKGIGENKREEGELPLLGLILCTEGCEDLGMDKTGLGSLITISSCWSQKNCKKYSWANTIITTNLIYKP